MEVVPMINELFSKINKKDGHNKVTCSEIHSKIKVIRSDISDQKDNIYLEIYNYMVGGSYTSLKKSIRKIQMISLFSILHLQYPH